MLEGFCGAKARSQRSRTDCNVGKAQGTHEVAVDDSGRVHILESTLALDKVSLVARKPTKASETHKDLVEEVLDELLLQRPAGEEAMEVGSQELRDKVDVLERGDEDVRERDNVLVLDVLEELEFAVGALCEDGRA